VLTGGWILVAAILLPTGLLVWGCCSCCNCGCCKRPYKYKESTRKILGLVAVGGLAVIGFMIFGGYSVDSSQTDAIDDFKFSVGGVKRWSDSTGIVINVGDCCDRVWPTSICFCDR
jgi:hypothetical protein